MAKPSEKLAASLEVLYALQESRLVAIRSKDLTRTHRERLCQNGFLQEVIKGWYIPARPDNTNGESSAWYASYWKFCSAYLDYRFTINWCLSAEQSVLLHAGNWTVPEQLLIRSPDASNNILNLPHNTSLLDICASIPEDKNIVVREGLRLITLSAALIACVPYYFRQNPIDMRAALLMVRDASDVLERLLEGGHSTVAGRLAGAFRNIGRDRIADDIIKTMRAAGYDVRENDPFESQAPVILSTQERSPYVNRLCLMWQDMREPIIKCFPQSPGLPKNIKTYLKNGEDNFVTDAYHSLSIEGYQVSPELIERVRSGTWNPELNEGDSEHRNALAARGYWQAFQAVQESIGKILQKHNPGDVVDADHSTWYRELFAPGITAGLLKPADLAGYRNQRVHIRGSMHVPLNHEAVCDAMSALFDLLREETEASVRIVLGHFVFVYIHPYVDGNGRMGRFLMNTMMASGGYSWTVVPVEKRKIYMAALENASVEQDIVPFAKFLAGLVESRL